MIREHIVHKRAKIHQSICDQKHIFAVSKEEKKNDCMTHPYAGLSCFNLTVSILLGNGRGKLHPGDFTVE